MAHITTPMAALRPINHSYTVTQQSATPSHNAVGTSSIVAILMLTYARTNNRFISASSELYLVCQLLHTCAHQSLYKSQIAEKDKIR